jgi:hypothetical protein
MTHKVISIFAALFVLALGWNCSRKPEPEFRPTVFIAKDIEATNMIYPSWGNNEISSIDPMETYVLRTQLIGDVLFVQKQQKPEFFFASAFASTPAPPRFDDTLKSIKITSLHDFDSSHLAGTNLIGFFSTSLNSYLDSSAQYPDLYNSNRPLNFQLKNKPLADSVQQFVIQIEFEKAGILTDTADAVTFQR